MGNIRKSFEANTVYHVFNHGHAKDLIFREDKNYEFFLKKYGKYISSIGDNYTYEKYFHSIDLLQRSFGPDWRWRKFILEHQD